MTVRVYRWDDVDAPVLTGQADSVINLLDAVLVNGYGANPPAGWIKEYSGVSKAGYKNVGGSGCGFWIENTDGLYTFIRGYESIDALGAITNGFPTVAQNVNGLNCTVTNASTSVARPWIIVGDSKRFYLWAGYSVSVSTGLNTTAGMPLTFIGDIISRLGGDAYHFALIAGTSNGTANYMGALTTLASAVMSAHYIARSHLQTGASLQFGKLAANNLVVQSGLGTAGFSYPDPVTTGMLLSPIKVCSSSIWRGMMPGLWSPMHALPGSPGDTFSGTGELSGKTFMLLDVLSAGSRCRAALEISDTWE